MMDEWIGGWTNERTREWACWWTVIIYCDANERTNEQASEQTNERTNKRTNERTNERSYGMTDWSVEEGASERTDGRARLLADWYTD